MTDKKLVGMINAIMIGTLCLLALILFANMHVSKNLTEFRMETEAVITNIAEGRDNKLVYTFKTERGVYCYSESEPTQHVTGNRVTLAVDSFFSAKEGNEKIGYYTTEHGAKALYMCNNNNVLKSDEDLKHLLINSDYTESMEVTVKDIVIADDICLYRFEDDNGVEFYSYAQLTPHVIGDKIVLYLHEFYKYRNNSPVGIYVVADYIYGDIYTLTEY